MYNIYAWFNEYLDIRVLYFDKYNLHFLFISSVLLNIKDLNKEDKEDLSRWADRVNVKYRDALLELKTSITLMKENLCPRCRLCLNESKSATEAQLTDKYTRNYGGNHSAKCRSTSEERARYGITIKPPITTSDVQIDYIEGNDEHNKLKKQYDELSIKLKDKEKEISDMIEDFKRLGINTKRYSSLACYPKLFEQQQKSYKDLETKYNATSTTYEKCRTEKEHIHTEFSKLHIEMGDTKQKYVTEIEELELKLGNVDLEVSSLKFKAEQEQRKFDNERCSLNTDISKNRKQISKLNTDNAIINERVNNLKKELKKSQTKLTQCNEELENCQDQQFKIEIDLKQWKDKHVDILRNSGKFTL